MSIKAGKSRKTVQWVVPVFLVALLAGCVTSDGGARTGLRALNEKNGLISISNDDYGRASTERIIYATAWEREEYVRYENTEARAEIMYIKTRTLLNSNLIIDRLFDLNGSLKSFRHTQNEVPIIGKAFRLNLQEIRYWAKPFQLQEAKETCAVFSANWDQPLNQHRSSKALFGYFCHQGTEPLSQNSIGKKISSIKIRKVTLKPEVGAINTPPLSDVPSQSELLLRVNGTSNTSYGNSKFPYKSIRIFNIDMQ